MGKSAKKGAKSNKSTKSASKPAVPVPEKKPNGDGGAKAALAKPKKGGKKQANGTAPFQKVGVIDTIIETCLQGATKSQVYEALTKRFPDRPLKGMKATVHTYLGGRLTKDKGYRISTKGEGRERVYVVAPPPTTERK